MKQSQTDIKHGDSVSQVSLDMVFHPIKDFLGITNDGQQGKTGFHDHTVIPGSFLADFHIVWHAISTAEPPISQQDSLLVVFLKKIQKGLIWTVHCVPNPAADLPKAVKNPTQLDTHTPPTFIAALGSKLPLGTSLSDRKNQFYRIAIHDIQHAGLRQQPIRIALLDTQLTQQRRAVWQAAKQSVEIALQPAIEGTEPSSFESKQDADADHFAGVQLVARILANWPQRIIDMAENVNDNIFRSHESASL